MTLDGPVRRARLGDRVGSRWWRLGFGWTDRRGSLREGFVDLDVDELEIGAAPTLAFEQTPHGRQEARAAEQDEVREQRAHERHRVARATGSVS